MAVTIDLADLRGYAYYTGMRFAVFAQGPQGAAMELARGGRYDEVGAVFGRKRPAVGFSLDLKELVGAVEPRPLVAAIRSPWGMEPGLRETVAELRAMEQRFEVALLLSDGMIYNDILDRTGASSATISRVNRSLQYGADGYQAVLPRIKEKLGGDGI